jgi:hypothetical protein
MRSLGPCATPPICGDGRPGVPWSFATSETHESFIVLGQPVSERSLVTRTHLSTMTSTTLHKASPRVISRGSRSSHNMALLMDTRSFLVGKYGSHGAGRR